MFSTNSNFPKHCVGQTQHHLQSLFGLQSARVSLLCQTILTNHCDKLDNQGTTWSWKGGPTWSGNASLSIEIKLLCGGESCLRYCYLIFISCWLLWVDTVWDSFCSLCMFPYSFHLFKLVSNFVLLPRGGHVSGPMQNYFANLSGFYFPEASSLRVICRRGKRKRDFPV